MRRYQVQITGRRDYYCSADNPWEAFKLAVTRSGRLAIYDLDLSGGIAVRVSERPDLERRGSTRPVTSC